MQRTSLDEAAPVWTISSCPLPLGSSLTDFFHFSPSPSQLNDRVQTEPAFAACTIEQLPSCSKYFPDVMRMLPSVGSAQAFADGAHAPSKGCLALSATAASEGRRKAANKRDWTFSIPVHLSKLDAYLEHKIPNFT
ncbi:Hypothetical protein MexAM1_META2p0778 (plasmid) [Methylorubrum extorquens AM1]|uniref:Uncharacterized protein n=1 Tax=Methylorubrum extorquens (strain ATCC 14718 / DSM 1338 / JCM 2805 / NCIMB 9133 / AM1) TaxID=272630 RepID=C5B588_METEA|nr:Hypothetical protein MexAM1_META2p0778 [Methylorubrum extorquens AM1]